MWPINLFSVLLCVIFLEYVVTTSTVLPEASSIVPSPQQSISSSISLADTSTPMVATSMLSVTSTIATTLSSSTSILSAATAATSSSNPNSFVTSSISDATTTTSNSIGNTAATSTQMTSSSAITPSKSTPIQPSSSAKPAPKVSYQKCATADNNCKNGGECFSGTEKICVCKGNFYGAKCETEGNPILRPLVYALGGTSGFLLIVICIALICSCKNANRYKTSKDLDGFNNIGLRAKGTINESYGD